MSTFGLEKTSENLCNLYNCPTKPKFSKQKLTCVPCKNKRRINPETNVKVRVVFSTLLSVFGYPDETLSLVFDMLQNSSWLCPSIEHFSVTSFSARIQN